MIISWPHLYICCFTAVSRFHWLSNRIRFCKEFCETYQSGTRLPVCFFDHTGERRAGRAPPLYHPHKDREREREDILKGIPHTPENNFSKVIWFQHSPPWTLQKSSSPYKCFLFCFVKISNFKESLQRVVSHILFSKRARLPNTSSIVFLLQVQAVKIEDGTWELVFVFTGNPLGLTISANSLVGIWQGSVVICLKIIAF